MDELNAVAGENRDQTLLRLQERAQQPQVPEGAGVPFVIVDGKVVDLEHLLSRPRRIREKATLHTCQSFIDYVTEHSGDVESVVFFDEGNEMFTAILDYHDGDPRWCQHRAIYKLPRSQEFVIWSANNRKGM